MTDCRHDQRAMGHVRIVARVLDDGRHGLAVAQAFAGQGKARSLATRQGDRHGVRKFAGDKSRVGGARRRRGAGAGGPAALERPAWLAFHNGGYTSARGGGKIPPIGHQRPGMVHGRTSQ